MAASLYGSIPSATVKQCSGKDNHDRLMALYHTGTDVKRHLLQYYLSQNKLDLAGFLYGKYQLLPPDYLKRALPTKNFQLLDLGIYTIDALLSDQCFDFFWDSCLDMVKTSLENILNRYKEILYRLYKTSGLDNQSARNERKCDFLSKKQWECLYNSPEMHEMQDIDFDISLTFPNKGITTQSFDNDMNFVLLSKVCPLYQSFQVVTTNQMKLSRIAVEHEINNEAFDEIWKLMTTHLKQISSYCIGEPWYDHNLNWIKEGTFKCVKAQENRKRILESTFDNKTFLEDAEFMTRVQKELNLIEAEETKDLVTKLCNREIPVLLVNGQYIAGSYPSAIEKAARKDLTSFQSVCSRQATDMKPVSTSKKMNVVEEQKNIDRHSYLRFVCLIQDIAKNVLVEVFKKRLNGADVVNTLNGMKNRLIPLLNGYQKELLYPNGRIYAGDLSDMDVSILYILLRNHGTICPHENGWGNDPEEHDNSIAANIDRIRIAKNVIVSHSSNCLLTYEEFKNRWAVIRQCCVELGGEEYEERIDYLSTSTFNSDLEQQFSKKLENFKETDMQSERYYRKLEEILDTVKEISDNLKEEQAFRESNNDTKHEEGFTPMILQIKGNSLPGKNEIEEKIGHYNNNDMHVTSVESGSIIIRLQMFSSAFQSLGYVLIAIDKLLQQAFSARPISEDNIVVCIILSMDTHQLSEDNTKMLSRKRLPDQSSQGSVGPSTAKGQGFSTTDTAFVYVGSGMTPQQEVHQQSSLELVRTNREIPDRGNKTSLPFGPQLYQRLKEHDEKDKVTAKTADLDDNRKRWLVVGICLHSVLSPALRRYVVPILTVLYNELTIKQKIDTQTYPTHLTKYLPTNVYLNYEAVNNNKARFGYQKAKYDYTIKSVVELSKLFLQPHMAHYTGFDETCDSSALLGLIFSINKFPPVVKSDAENVRRNIRNPWAQCDFTEWDAVKYSDSFKLMEKLVQDLSLSSTEEHRIIGEMKKWEMNGQHLLSGTTLGPELVDGIRQQTHMLAEYTKLIANETDHDSMTIKHVPENFDILLYTLTQLEKDMKTGFLEINKRLLTEEEIHFTLFDTQKGEIEFWKQQDVVFVASPVVNVILKRLESVQSVLIVGEPGIGKSMLLHNVALKMQKKIDYDIIPCSGIQDILQHHKEGNKQMFVLDDICGQFTVSLSDIEQWMKYEDKLKRILKEGKTKIAATCRLDIYNDEKFIESCTVFKGNICNLSVEYSREDKLTICRHYLSETNIQLIKDKNVDFTPLMCYLYSKNETFNLTDFLECPFETYQKEWDKLRVFDPYKYCSLFLCVVCNGTMTDSLFDWYNENNTKRKSVFENILENCGIDRGTSKSKIKSVLDSMIGTYVIKIRNQYRVIHDQMFDFMCCYFGNKDTMVRCILRYADIRVFNQRTQLESVNEEHGKFTIMISKKQEKEYFERIKSEVQLGNLNQCFSNTQMKYDVYRTSFVKILKSIDDKLLIAQIYQRNLAHGYDSIETRECEDYSYDDQKQKKRLNLRHAYSIKTMEWKDSSSDNNDDDDKEMHLDEVPLITSCLRGYHDIVQYFISKRFDIKNCESFHTPLTAACKGGNEKIVHLLIEKGGEVNQVDNWRYTPLSAACSRRNEKIVQLLIDNGSNVNQVDGLKQSPLTAACSGGNEKIVHILIDKGSKVNQIDGMRQTPLTTACNEGNEKIVQLLLEKGSNVNLVNGMGQTPLTSAYFRRNEKIVQLLLEKGNKVNLDDDMKQSLLKAACTRGNKNMVQLLIEKGSKVNLHGEFAHTPLTAACTNGHENIVQLLIDNGSRVNGINGLGRTPLTATCEKGNGQIVQLLIDKGCDVNLNDGLKQTPLTGACIKGNEQMAHLLISKGCDVNLVDGMGQTPMTAACSKGNEKIVQLLIDKGCDINKVYDKKQTSLTAACSKRNEKIVQLLIDKGCDINKVDGMKQTPLMAAVCIGRNEKIVQLLIDKGCDVNQVDGMKQTPLMAAVCIGRNEKIVQLLIDKGCDVNQVDGMKQTPLMTACRRGKAKIVQLLLDKGSDVNQIDGMKQTPLTAACCGGNEKIVQLLLDKGSDVNQIDGMKQTPLTAACSGESGESTPFSFFGDRGNDKIVQLLLDKGSDLNKAGAYGGTPLTISCDRGNEKIVQLLMDKGCEVNQVDGMKQTPLMTAYRRGNEQIVQLLIDKECDVNQVDRMKQTPLTAACRRGNEKIVQLLISKDCDINLVDGMKQTPLTAACRVGNKKIVQLLIDKGCDVNLVDDMKQTPLTAACSRGTERIVQLLLDKGSDVNQVDGMKQTPLMAACSGGSGERTPFLFFGDRGNEKIVQLLLDKGSNLNKADAYGRTPLTMSCDRGNETIVQLLIDKGSEVNQVDGMKQTPLMAACRRGNEKIVKLLLDRGCDINKTNGIGQTPLTISRERGNKKILQLLLDKEKEVNQADGIGQTP